MWFNSSGRPYENPSGLGIQTAEPEFVPAVGELVLRINQSSDVHKPIPRSRITKLNYYTSTM